MENETFIPKAFYGQPENCYFASGEPPYEVSLEANGWSDSDEFEDFDSCFLWALYRLMQEYRVPEELRSVKVRIVDRECFSLECNSTETLMENVWKTMTDLPFTFEDRLECDWFIFEKGTDRESIMDIFDLWYPDGSRGLEEKFQ